MFHNESILLNGITEQSPLQVEQIYNKNYDSPYDWEREGGYSP
jgi:hypothetical protein